MTRHPTLTAVPPAPIASVIALYAVALDVARHALHRYSAAASQLGDGAWPVRSVFEVLAAREARRIDRLEIECFQACGRVAAHPDVPWRVPHLVPDQEVTEVQHSELATPYTAWAMAVEHRRRAFVFWSYVIAVATDRTVQDAAEAFAHEALSDGNLLRHERRLAWRALRDTGRQEGSEHTEPESAALLESLLQKDVWLWSRLAPSDRSLLTAAIQTAPDVAPSDAMPDGAPLELIKGRALRRAEQLSSLYLDDADRATDQDSLELAQKLAARSIVRLAGLRQAAASVVPR
ncbi:hypothetical protein [Rhodopseudomonas sp.]|uniref:hypothetical protein n=1 Tax=Rhodopseudomonas sp. TaxID=1078 RepID=UPI003B3B75B4